VIQTQSTPPDRYAVKQLSKTQALKMWANLRGHFVSAEKAIAEIIAAKAWEPLGFASFAEAWADRMQGVPLATDSIRAHVVYAMVEAGLDDAAVLAATGIGSQVGPRSVSALRRQKAAGVPAGMASTRVRAHTRCKPSQPHIVRVSLQPSEYEAFRALSAELRTDPGELAAGLIREYLRRQVAA